jgi:uncharacterized protein with FMN-binding domain
MRPRAPLVLAATVAGVAAVLSYQPHSKPAGRRPQPAGIVATAPPSARRAPAGRRPHHHTGGKAGGATRQPVTVIGADAPNQYGDVQVRVKVLGKRIVAVDAVTLPGSDARSQEISAVAGPILRRQAIAAQSARVDGVSGASYTSAGYRQSLQSALDRLGSTHRPATA